MNKLKSIRILLFPLFIFLTVIFSFCRQEKNVEDLQENSKISNMKEEYLKKLAIPVGFLTYNKEVKQPVFRLFNSENQLFEKFSFLGINKKIRPFAWQPDNYLLVFRCVKKDKNGYVIISNEESNEIRYINFDDVNFKFETVEEHILSVFSVEFDSKSNPVRSASTDSSNIIPYDDDEFYFPTKIKGSWLQIQWGSEDDLKEGWIKWKEDNNIVIDWFYFA